MLITVREKHWVPACSSNWTGSSRYPRFVNPNLAQKEEYFCAAQSRCHHTTNGLLPVMKVGWESTADFP